MFKKLKDKIAEEVKSSPSRIQQLAQAAQAAVSSASSSVSDIVSGSGENFFSIAEEDTPQNTPQHSNAKTTDSGQLTTSMNSLNSIPLNNGSTSHTYSRTRKLSNSSLASDVSFRLPTYEHPAVYQMQSDLESASEFEFDGSSMQNAQLDMFSKEQLHHAYKSALERYQKYRNRYTEVARRYRDLERDNTKARSVLVETQDKALRRISELREQCSLEQQAKAHLESALRLEMEEMQCVIKTLTSKLSLLGENADDVLQNGQENLINLDHADAVNLISLNTDNGNHLPDVTQDKVKKMEEIIEKYKEQVNEEKSKLIVKNEEIRLITIRLDESQKKIKELTTREEENTILLAENKRRMLIFNQPE